MIFRAYKYENVDKKMKNRKRWIENDYIVMIRNDPYSSDALKSKHTFESPYVSPGLGILHPTQGMKKKR